MTTVLKWWTCIDVELLTSFTCMQDSVYIIFPSANDPTVFYYFSLGVDKISDEKNLLFNLSTYYNYLGSVLTLKNDAMVSLQNYCK